MKSNTTKQPLEDRKEQDNLTDRLLDNPMQEEEDFKDLIDAAYPDSKEGLHTQKWYRGSNYGGECNIMDEAGHLIATDINSDTADIICQAVNERKALLDSHRELIEMLEFAQNKICGLYNTIRSHDFKNGKNYWEDEKETIETMQTAINNANKHLRQ